MPRLTPCPSCESHIIVGERECPHCGISLGTTVARASAVLMGLALAGCPGFNPEPDYGVPDTTTGASETGMATDTEMATDDSGSDTGMDGTGTDSATTSGSDSAGEAEYGVLETTPDDDLKEN